MTYFGQELFELAEATTGLSDPIYRDARKLCVDLTRRHGIDQVMREQHLDAIVAPTYSYGSSAPAVAGYPNISLPTGVTADGRPGGIWMYGRFLSEPKLLAYAYDLEQEIGGRPLPQFLGKVPALPPDAGICPVPLAAQAAPKAAAARRLPGRLADAAPLIWTGLARIRAVGAAGSGQRCSQSTQRSPSHQRCQVRPSRPRAKTSSRSVPHDDAVQPPAGSSSPPSDSQACQLVPSQ